MSKNENIDDFLMSDEELLNQLKDKFDNKEDIQEKLNILSKLNQEDLTQFMAIYDRLSNNEKSNKRVNKLTDLVSGLKNDDRNSIFKLMDDYTNGEVSINRNLFQRLSKLSSNLGTDTRNKLFKLIVQLNSNLGDDSILPLLSKFDFNERQKLLNIFSEIKEQNKQVNENINTDMKQNLRAKLHNKLKNQQMQRKTKNNIKNMAVNI